MKKNKGLGECVGLCVGLCTTAKEVRVCVEVVEVVAVSCRRNYHNVRHGRIS